jgi:hypothetical protein
MSMQNLTVRTLPEPPEAPEEPDMNAVYLKAYEGKVDDLIKLIAKVAGSKDGAKIIKNLPGFEGKNAVKDLQKNPETFIKSFLKNDDDLESLLDTIQDSKLGDKLIALLEKTPAGKALFKEISDKIDNELTKMGVDVKKLKQDNHGDIEMSIFDNTNESQKILIDLYNNTNIKSYGASGSIFGFMIIYPFLFIKRKKSILLNLIVLYFVIDITMVINKGIYHDLAELATTFLHLGGGIGGIVFFIFWLLYLKNKTVGYLFTENKKVIQNEAAPILQINAS